MNEESIIHNELPLTEAFIPTRLLHREGQLRELERCLKLALRKKSVENVFLVGPSGTGKTTVVRWILEMTFLSKLNEHQKVIYEILEQSLEVWKNGESPLTTVKRRGLMPCVFNVESTLIQGDSLREIVFD